jgi:hypothetical protein
MSVFSAFPANCVADEGENPGLILLYEEYCILIILN